MAIVKLGATVVGIRGTVGGITYSANGAGPYCKLWGRGANPRTTKQGVVRSRVGVMPELWRGLSQGQKDDWNDYAAEPEQELVNALGEGYYTTGYAWFVHCNSALLNMGQATIEEAPVIAVPAAPEIHFVFYGLNVGVFYMSTQILQHTYDPFNCMLQARAIPASGRSVNYGGWRQLGVRWARVGDDWSASWTAEHEAIWGTATDGWRIFLRARDCTDEGRCGPWGAYRKDFT